MASKKRSTTPLATEAWSAKKKRDDRADRRAAAPDHREQARRDEITKSNTINSPFLRLPGEIRNMIYGYIFTDELYNFLDYHSGGEVEGGDMGLYKLFEENDMGLLLVSRQVHEETALLPFKMGIFAFESEREWEHWEYVKEFLESRSRAQIVAMRRMWIFDDGTWLEDDSEREETGEWWFKELGCVEIIVNLANRRASCQVDCLPYSECGGGGTFRGIFRASTSASLVH